MKILSLDQSSHISGYSVFDTDTSQLIAYGHFTFEDSSLDIRLVKIRSTVQSLIEEYHPSKIYLEDIQYQTNIGSGVTTYKALAEVIGVISELVAEIGLPCELIHSQSWKSTCGIKGRARAEQKKNAQQFVQHTYGVQATQDECDSICLGAHAIQKEACAWQN